MATKTPQVTPTPSSGAAPILKTGVSTAKEPVGFDRTKAIAITNVGTDDSPVYEIRSTKGTVLWRGINQVDAENFRDAVPLATFISG